MDNFLAVEPITDFGDFRGIVLGDFMAPKLKFVWLRFSAVGLNGVVLLGLEVLGFFTCYRYIRYIYEL